LKLNLGSFCHFDDERLAAARWACLGRRGSPNTDRHKSAKPPRKVCSICELRLEVTSPAMPILRAVQSVSQTLDVYLAASTTNISEREFPRTTLWKKRSICDRTSSQRPRRLLRVPPARRPARRQRSKSLRRAPPRGSRSALRYSRCRTPRSHRASQRTTRR